MKVDMNLVEVAAKHAEALLAPLGNRWLRKRVPSAGYLKQKTNPIFLPQPISMILDMPRHSKRQDFILSMVQTTCCSPLAINT